MVPTMEFSDPRDRFIHRVAKNKSFVDVGGLWGTKGERVSVAHAAGARELTMIDGCTAGDEWWQKFEARRQDLGVPPVRSISGEIVQLSQSDASLKFEVVHCSGVLYHAAEPLRLLRALRTVTTGHLILSSCITDTVIENEAGTLRVPDGGALFVPALTAQERAIVYNRWSPAVGRNAIGLTNDDTDWNPDDTGPWWWLPTTKALAAMCRVAGFVVEDVAEYWDGHAASVLARVN